MIAIWENSAPRNPLPSPSQGRELSPSHIPPSLSPVFSPPATSPCTSSSQALRNNRGASLEVFDYTDHAFILWMWLPGKCLPGLS